MIITRTPFRISFFGGGTDYPVYYNDHGGAVLSTTINKYCYLHCRYLPPFFDYNYRIRYTKMETTKTIEEIQHLSVRECLKFVGIKGGVEMLHSSDIPAMSGIGSSSSFTVGFLNALYSLMGKMVTKRELAFDAIHVEQERIGEHVGSQDQTAAAFGGFNKIEFGGRETIFVRPITISEEKIQYLQKSMLFYFTGFARNASEIAYEQICNTKNRISELHRMHEMVDEAIAVLNGSMDRINEFGTLLHESWMLKRCLTNKISNGSIDELYQLGRNGGAIGGKLCGAGGGGFILFFVPPERQKIFREKMSKLLLVPFRFENFGSHVIFYSKEDYPVYA